MAVLTLAFVWFMSPLGLGFRMGGAGVRLQMADGLFRFSYFIVNPSMVLLWMGLPWFHCRGIASVGWKLLGFVLLLLLGCAATVFALL